MESKKEKDFMAEIKLLRDTLAEKELEIEALKISSLFWRTLFDGINEEIMVIDNNYAIRDVNKTFLEHYALCKKDVLGKKCYAVAFQSDEPCYFDGRPCPLEKAKRTGKRVDVTHSRKQEGEKPKELVRIMYPLAAKGKRTEYFIEISRDVTEYKALIKRLKASQKKLRAILDTATDAILSVDENHNIVLFNNAAQRIFGYSRPEVLGKNLNMLIPSQYGDHFRFVKTFLETKTPKIMEKTMSLTAYRKGGEEFPIKLGISYREIEGRIVFTAVIRDVSVQKQLEKKLLQSERLAAVGQTVAHVAHEIKNPLMIIGGFSQQIKRSLLDPKEIQKLDMVLDEVNRMEKLIANLGDFTKQYKLVKRPSDIKSVIQDVLKIIAEIYSSEKYEFVAYLPPDLEEINCDPDKMKQVFMNIIGNGIEAMEDGGTIKISARRYTGSIEIRISDEGIGIDDEALLHIFEPFFTTRESGSGLGLSISYKIVEAHKGEISAFSLPGEGTTFVIRLPVQ